MRWGVAASAFLLAFQLVFSPGCPAGVGRVPLKLKAHLLFQSGARLNRAGGNQPRSASGTTAPLSNSQPEGGAPSAAGNPRAGRGASETYILGMSFPYYFFAGVAALLVVTVAAWIGYSAYRKKMLEEEEEW